MRKNRLKVIGYIVLMKVSDDWLGATLTEDLGDPGVLFNGGISYWSDQIGQTTLFKTRKTAEKYMASSRAHHKDHVSVEDFQIIEVNTKV